MADLVKTLGRSMVPRHRSLADNVREFLVFVLASEVYAVELARIREIVSPPPMTEVPRARPDVVGVCSVRGLLVTVIDLRLRMNVTAAPETRISRILLAYSDSGEVVGLLVDEVRQVVRLSEKQIEEAHSILGDKLSENVMGIGRVGSEVIVLLDLSRVTS
jgi:purine-binding chemotaxis protein CheW